MPAVPERLQSHLEPGERVLWVGSPSLRWFSLHALLEIAGQALLVCLILGGGLYLILIVSGDLGEFLPNVLEMDAFSPADRWLWIFFLLSAVAVSFAGSVLVVGAVSWLNWSHRRKDRYAITNRGFLWQRSVWPFSPDNWPVHRFPLEEVNALEVVHHADGTGTLTFLDVWVELNVDESVNAAFTRIPDLDQALTVAYLAAEEAGIPFPERPTGGQVLLQTLRDYLGCSVVGSVAAVAVCLGAAIALGLAISGPRGDLERVLAVPFLLRRLAAFPGATGVMFAAAFVGLWSLAVRKRLRRHPHLARLRRLLAMLRVVLALVWLGAMAWIVLALMA